VLNGLSPNGDGVNDIWQINGLEGVQCTPNEVTIYNRWGDVVWKEENYNNDDVVWKGLNRKDNRLPEGTYFYVIKIVDKKRPCTGWIQIMR